MMNVVRKLWGYYRKNGCKLLLLKLMDRHRGNPDHYMEWRAKNKASAEILEKQSAEKFRSDLIISIAVPVYHTPEKFLREMIESVQNQSYSGWELCIADGSKDESTYLIIQEYAKNDTRIKVKKLNENKGIADNTNAAIDMCTGNYIGLLDHDDLLEPDALYEIRKAVDKNQDVDVIYTDEDKISVDGKVFFDPHFKSDYNRELLRSNNYICHFFVVKKEILERVGGLRNKYDGAQDYDFILRCTENAKTTVHVARPLYHWRAHRDSTAENPESKMYAYQSGKKAIEDHLKRQGEKAKVQYTDFPGFYHVKYEIVSPDWVTVAILKQNCKTKQIDKCISSIKRTIGYSNYNICTVNSITDLSEKSIKGKYILLINGTISMISHNWMEELLGACQRERTGAVGIKLYNKDETIKHAGIILGMNGYAFEGWPRVRQGYFHRDALMQNLNAVTQNFILVSKELFFAIKKEIPGKMADEIQFCQRIRERNKEIIYNPNVEAYIHVKTGIGEMKTIIHDNYYNVNLDLDSTGYRLKHK